MSKSFPAVLGGPPASERPVPFVRPLLPSYEAIEPGVRNLFSTGQLTKGPCLGRFEDAIAEHLGVRHAIGVSSCTTGLMLAYKCAGLEGDVVVPSFTFMATVSALVWAGLQPVYADVDLHTATLDIRAVEQAITPRTSAIVAVHTFGNPASITALQNLAQRRGLKLIFDAAHGFGSMYRGARLGSQGDAQVFSLSPTKLLIAGEGGIVTTNDDELAIKIRYAREYGNDGSYDSVLVGFNARMAEFNALLGLQSLSLLEHEAQRRNELATLYMSELEGVPGIEFVRVQPGNRCSYKDFSLLINEAAFGLNRDQLAIALQAENIDSRKYYFPAVHRQTAYQDIPANEAELPNTCILADNSLSVPLYSQLTETQVVRIAGAIKRLQEWAPHVRVNLALRDADSAGALATDRK
ncbi:DegT/DnrJ/EryC1/StrS family aminotransferase [Anatilimnocola floriformis]|uniref:DegT/DnrJ/EryC1/StrS family aminotransferase n=1 Tax=Anatilimnocola floriformis TaxID=2948575 RepID=UPI0020C2D3CB|nr:DegT/DnrJ/EryC1/StrS family aminotransferase [Anatilimnocola floriformis]